MRSKYKMLLFAFLMITAPVLMFAQNVGINEDGSSPDSSAMLDVKSTTKGMLVPRLTAAQIEAIANPADGLQAYNTDDGNVYVFVFLDNVWKKLNYGTGTIHPSPPVNCENPIIDTRDGKSYSTVLIGTQCWMAQNLNVGIQGYQTDNSIIEKYCYYWEDSVCDVFGGLYSWDEAMQYYTTPGVRGICPQGWHLPTNAEMATLTDYVNSQTPYQCNSISGWIAKALAASTFWEIYDTYYTCAIGDDLSLNNVTGFSALPGGMSFNFDWGNFIGLGEFGTWWSSSNYSADFAWCMYMDISEREVFINYTNKFNWQGEYIARSVRCVQD
jgi:uncharacterized protein (TIGR02145 family)